MTFGALQYLYLRPHAYTHAKKPRPRLTCEIRYYLYNTQTHIHTFARRYLERGTAHRLSRASSLFQVNVFPISRNVIGAAASASRRPHANGPVSGGGRTGWHTKHRPAAPFHTRHRAHLAAWILPRSSLACVSNCVEFSRTKPLTTICNNNDCNDRMRACACRYNAYILRTLYTI